MKIGTRVKFITGKKTGQRGTIVAYKGANYIVRLPTGWTYNGGSIGTDDDGKLVYGVSGHKYWSTTCGDAICKTVLRKDEFKRQCKKILKAGALI